MITITVQDAVSMRDALQRLASAKGLSTSAGVPLALVYDIAEKMAVIGVKAAIAERTRLIAFKQRGTLDTKTGTITVSDADAAAIQAEMEPLMAGLLQVPGDKIKLSALAAVDLSPMDLTPLVKLLENDLPKK